MTKRKIYALSGFSLFVLLAAASLWANVFRLPITKDLDVQYAADFGDDKKLVGASHNVFVGKVISQVRNQEGVIPTTEFLVEVVSNIKGNLSGTVGVIQSGGYRDGVFYTLEGGDAIYEDARGTERLLKVGTTYVFATRYYGERNLYGIIPHANATRAIETGGSVDIDDLKEFAETNTRVQELRVAYPTEILYDLDVKQAKTYNSYQTRQYDGDGVVIDDTVEIATTRSTVPSSDVAR